MRNDFSLAARSATVLALLVAFTGCATLSQTERGAVIGSVAGAAVGAAVSGSGNTARGAVVGAAVGGATGAIVGRQMDKRAEELQKEVPGAQVERVGDDILVTFDSGILFDFDSASLRPESRTELRRFAENMRRNADTHLVVLGHTDSTGSVDYNMGLSRRRADAATNFLVMEGVDRSRIRADGRGPHEPVASNATDAGRQSNRRVEITISLTEEARERMEREHAEGHDG